KQVDLSKESYIAYKNLLKKAYSQGIAKTDIDLMVYFLAKYTDLNKRWNLIAKTKASREIRGLWTGSSFVELERGEFVPDSTHTHNAEKPRTYLTHDFLRAMLFPSNHENKVLYFLKNIPAKYNWTNRFPDIVVNEKISLKNLEKVYVDAGECSSKDIDLINETKQNYPYIEFVFVSNQFNVGTNKEILELTDAQADIGFLSAYYQEGKDMINDSIFYKELERELIKKLLSEKQNTLNKLIKLNEKGKELKKEQANSYRLYLEGIDIDIDFLTKLEKNIKLYKNFYSDNKDSFDKLKLVENKLQGTDITFKEFRKQWDDWFPHLEQYDYFKNIIHSGGYASKLSRQINEEINKIDSGKYENEEFDLDSGVEFKKEYLKEEDKYIRTYVDKKGDKWFFKRNPEGKEDAFAESCAYEFAKLIDPNAVEVKYYEYNGQIGSLQKMIPHTNSLYDTKIKDLIKPQLIQLQMHSVIDWLIENRDSNANNFRLKNKTIYAIDKASAFYSMHLNKNIVIPDDLFTHSVVYKGLYKAHIDGIIDLKWQDIEPFIKKAEAISDAKYINIFRPYVEERFKDDLKKKKEFIKLMLERKRNVRKDFEKLYKSLAEERQKNGFPVSEKPNNKKQQETQSPQSITDRLGGAMNQLIEKADGTITKAEEDTEKQRNANANNEPSEQTVDFQNPKNKEEIQKQEDEILKDINKAIKNLDELDGGDKS
ncbi:MAG: hypothetical protein KAQ92_03265, partial [Candidatus Aenigmarchaeota archaeon]|nr:hypothetical protein [Candidatus Aenigmarchaeota archaeon]